MGQTILKYTVRFIFLITVQVLILNQIKFSGYFTPYIYIAFILMLPLDIPKTALLILSFMLGIVIDMFSNSPGMHAAACVFMAFCRPAVINLISIKKDFEDGITPTVKNMGAKWVFLYTLILVFIHHSFLFFVEIFSFNEFFKTISRAFLSSMFSFLIIIISHYLFEKLSKK